MSITFSAKERADKISYICEAMAEGYTQMLKMPLHMMSDIQLRDEHGRAWQFFDMQTSSPGVHTHNAPPVDAGSHTHSITCGERQAELAKYDHACTNCFADQGPCLSECAVSDENAAKLKHDQRPNGFEEAAKPLIKWLAENVHPHHTAIVTSNSAELLEGSMSFPTDEFLKD